MKMPGFLLLALFHFVLTSTLTQAADFTCADATVKKVQRTEFQYAYRYIKGAPGAPVVIVLPGGPGGASINSVDQLPAFPPNFGVIYTDPRGVGCNTQSGPVPDSFYSTELLAADVLAIVQAERLDRYILFGTSYGTLLATVIAGLAERGAAPRPEAIVLQGVLGRAFKPGEVFEEFIQQWKNTTQRLSPALKEEFLKPAPFGLSRQLWAQAISGLALFGKEPRTQKRLLDAVLNLFSDGPASPHYQYAHKFIQGFNTGEIKPNVEQLYRVIACQEIATEVYHHTADIQLELKGLELVAIPGELCRETPMVRPFDAREWQTSSPIYYFEGDEDPSTPMAQALYHFNSQSQASRTFIKVVGGSHIPLMYTLSDCWSALCQSIGQKGDGLSDVLAACRIETHILPR